MPQKTVAALRLQGRIELEVSGDLSLPLGLRRDGAEQVVERLLDVPGREGRHGAGVGEAVEVKPLVVADETVREVGPPRPLVEPPAAVGWTQRHGIQYWTTSSASSGEEARAISAGLATSSPSSRKIQSPEQRDASHSRLCSTNEPNSYETTVSATDS